MTDEEAASQLRRLAHDASAGLVEHERDACLHAVRVLDERAEAARTARGDEVTQRLGPGR